MLFIEKLLYTIWTKFDHSYFFWNLEHLFLGLFSVSFAFTIDTC